MDKFLFKVACACLFFGLILLIFGCDSGSNSMDSIASPAPAPINESPPMIEDDFRTHPDILGSNVQQASFIVDQLGLDSRVTCRDGEFLPATMDYRIGRHNFHVEKDIVVGYIIEGSDGNFGITCR